MYVNEPILSGATIKQLDRMVERVARKAGYTGREELTYAEFIRNQLRATLANLQTEARDFRRKLSLKPSNRDFAEEIKAYLRDGLTELMNEGHSEDEALQITLAKFDQAELNEEFADFLRAFDHFGLAPGREAEYWMSPNQEAIGLFYGAFVIIGGALGALIGYMTSHGLVNVLVGLAAGCCFGVGGGLLSHAVITLNRKQ